MNSNKKKLFEKDARNHYEPSVLFGLGLIGGSIAKAIRKYHEDYRILAYDQDRETLATAVSSNMIDAVCEEHDERFKGCDYIFLCTPVEYNVSIWNILKRISVLTPSSQMSKCQGHYP